MPPRLLACNTTNEAARARADETGLQEEPARVRLEDPPAAETFSLFARRGNDRVACHALHAHAGTAGRRSPRCWARTRSLSREGSSSSRRGDGPGGTRTSRRRLRRARRGRREEKPRRSEREGDALKRRTTRGEDAKEEVRLPPIRRVGLAFDQNTRLTRKEAREKTRVRRGTTEVTSKTVKIGLISQPFFAPKFSTNDIFTSFSLYCFSRRSLRTSMTAPKSSLTSTGGFAYLPTMFSISPEWYATLLCANLRPRGADHHGAVIRRPIVWFARSFLSAASATRCGAQLNMPVRSPPRQRP